ncbi:MAG: alpha/beta hydrolase [Spirosomaceae bacterium]|jgi:pimeloyl-ACP methyl ester carboxylesterase|nr:alpha/beta hydrolase [Spirosomataceae bacterium]
MKNIIALSTLIFLFSACQKEEITISTNAKDLFYVKNKGASMPILVEGNTSQKAFVLVVHGGPGSDAMSTMNNTFMDVLEGKYAVAYWDQRNGGNTQGGANHDNLNIATMTEDLRAVVLTLKSRYGSNISVFLYAHSFGGCLSASFLTKSNYQTLVKGWIDIDGAHNFPLMDTESKKMQIAIGTVEKNAGRNVAEWTSLIDFANNNNPRENPTVSGKFNGNAYTAIKLIDEVNKVSLPKVNDLAYSPNSLLSRVINFNSVYFNNGLEQELFNTEFSSKLSTIKTPTLCLFGKYDFVVPPALADDVMAKIGSTFKKKVIFNNSGHDPYLTETVKLNAEIIAFIEQFK